MDDFKRGLCSAAHTTSTTAATTDSRNIGVTLNRMAAMMLSGVLFFLVLLAGQVGIAQDKPNIVWIVSEDNNASMIGCYGNPFSTTPNIDRLATQGLRYTNAFATAPVCAPSRCSIITGVYPPSMGTEHMRSNYAIPAEIKFFPKLLRDAGYYTTNNSKKDYNTVDQPDAWDESSDQATYKNRKEGQPFFAVFNLFVSHESSIHKRETLKHDPAQVKLPPYHPSTKEMREDWAQYYDKVEAMDEMVGKILKDLDEEGLAENTIVFYYADNGGVLPRSKRYLYESGLHVPMIIRVPEKFRDRYKASPGTTSDRLVTFLDLAPTVLSMAGVKSPDYLQGKSLLGTNAGPEPRYAYGFRGRMDERIDLSRTVRDKKYRYIRNYMPHLPYGQHLHYLWLAASTRSWESEYKSGRLDDTQAAFWKVKPSEELYDIQADPDNVKNLAKDIKYDSVLQRMRMANHAWIIKSKDLGFIPEAILYEFSESGAAVMLHAPKPKELERILETAEMATARDLSHLKNLQQRLKDTDPVVRYWAAVGTTIFPAKMYSSKTSLENLLLDPEGAVQAAAAEALYQIGEKERGLNALLELVKSPNPFVRVQAINVLQTFDSEAQKVLPVIRSIIPEGAASLPAQQNGYDVRAALTYLETFEPRQ